MNMNNNPTIEELEKLVQVAHDDKANHVLWVDTDGNVELTALPDDLGPVELEANTPEMKMRYETFGQSNGYVGHAAAQDQSFMDRIFKSLCKEWQTKSQTGVDYIDIF